MVPALGRIRALPARSKALAVGLMLVGLAATAIALFLGRDAALPLFAEPLRPEQVSEVVERLAAWNVPFVAIADNIRVAPRRRNELLLRLSMAGIPHVHVSTSAEALAKAGPLTPQSVLDAEQRQGLAGDLELALRGVSGIDDARVILAPERPAIFGDETARPPTASVRLTLHPGVAPTGEMLAGVRAFVASAVTGLEPHRVAVLDDRGVALGDGTVAPAEGKALESSLQSALDAAFGAGSTIVRVRVTYDVRTHEVHDAKREPLGQKAIRSVRADERYANDKKRYVKSSIDEDRGSALHDERIAVAAGAMERITAAVLVDAARKLDVPKIRAIAAATVGLDPQRGDAISVETIAFRRASFTPMPLRDAALGYAASLAPLLVVSTALIVALRLLWRPLLDCFVGLSAQANVRRLRTTTDVAPEALRKALAGEPPHAVAAVLSGLSAPAAAALLEAYDERDRSAIVQCMAYNQAPVARDIRSLLGTG